MLTKKIIFFSRDLKIGGMEKALVSLLNSLQSMDCEITLVLTNKTGELLDRLNPEICVKEYKVSNCKFIPLRRAINLLKRIVWGMKNKNKYDFSCNYATYLTIGSKLAAIASNNSSLYVHSDYYNYYNSSTKTIKNFFNEQGISNLKRLIFVSNEALYPIAEIYPEYKNKFSVISNLFDVTNIISLSNESICEQKKHKELLVFVGRLEEQSKRLTRLLSAFEMVCKNSNDYELWIVGGGDGFELCEQFVTKHNMNKFVKMMGEKSNPYPYINAADCVVLTSDYEGFPVIYNECMVLKKPIITTVPVSDDFIDVRDFSVVVEKNPVAISDAIINKEYKKTSFNNLDFDEINQKRLEQIKGVL